MVEKPRQRVRASVVWNRSGHALVSSAAAAEAATLACHPTVANAWHHISAPFLLSALVPWTRTHKPFQRMGFIAQVQRPSGLLPVQAARDRIPPWRLSILSAEHPPAVSAWSRSGWRHPHGTRWPEHGLQVSKKTRLARHTVPLIVVKCFAYALGWIIERSSKPAPPSLAMVSRTATTQYPPHVFQGRKTKNCQLHLSVHTPTR